ncbi:hypothetical protein WG901_04535 [Novosphingobium sp. PS1R-30]|uniref:Lipoprotein n=1 Tax=Novosphingobium anseongense TaxID=3133436 RepID=A0ABU8RSD6_9SPHN|nr:MAG: hypothetical protein EOO76_02360 [Novosphingobium sp.]
MPCALLSACGGQTPAEKAAADARAVAEVEAAQKRKPPIQPLELGVIDPTVRRVFNLSDNGCGFFTDPNPGAFPLAVIGSDKAVFQLNGEPAILASDSGSPLIAAGIRAKYVGRQQSAQIARGPDRLTIRDSFERIVYQATGILRCTEPAR